jgi:hypothetical protein
MGNRNPFLLILSSAGMALSCIYACSSFVLASLSRRPLPVFETAAILFLAVITTHQNKRLRRKIYQDACHTGACLLSFLWLCHRYYTIKRPLWDLYWLKDFLVLERHFFEWLALVVILISVWILWRCGVRLYARPPDRTTMSYRFDTGLAFFLSLLLIKLIIKVKGGAIPMVHSSAPSVITFMVLGLFSMGVVRAGSSSQTGTVTYFKGVGVVLSFTFLTLMLGGGLFILFLPALQSFAETGQGVLERAARPMEQVLIVLVRFFLDALYRQQLTGDVLMEERGGMGLPGDGGMVFLIVGYLVAGITIAIVLAGFCFLIRRLIIWLAKRVGYEVTGEKEKLGIWNFLLLSMAVATRLLSMLWRTLKNEFKPSITAEIIYQRLLRWGRFSGLGHVATETPKEYGVRLEHCFPRIKEEIRLIIHLHDETVYGCISADGHQMSRARRALRNVRNPRLWFARIKSIAFSNRYPG